MWGLPLGLGALAMLALVVLRWTAEEYAAQGRLSDSAAAVAWALSVCHGALTFLAALAGVYEIAVARWLALAFGISVLGLGAALLVAGVREMGSLDAITGRRTARLTTTGPYRYGRHPQNLGWGLMLLGAAVAGRSGLALILVAAYAVLTWLQVRIEERHLSRTYGEDHARYRAATSRLLGRPR